ncbi:MAG: universal stress protein [Candidatus Marinimicrobia bacterium]|jgi:nucleotide-binding universal stress UspA family protein|nr:universal stress protein [Candidatus Neomarinimicrobiota bacterium]MBT3675969.1 universal stress protein [Candidatus Neomarinimicrobiota bacterium]MBT3762460.1 universal stress protein [Candidatus Neomarinimicrobiota bacterium]MBT4068050.1 universal stress protein [Candidatus Neomarinimicrobiota bacterium]MBT4270206.1 universal stress protein [Candidatus Neomarinimicrobiota bacterium]
MKILIAVSSKEYSGPTLSAGMKIAHAFNASTTIVDVGEKVSEFSTKVVGLAQERMESWNFDRPGVDVLEWAFSYLAEKEFIQQKEIEAGFPKNMLVETSGSRSEVYLKGTLCDNVNLILRNGDIIAELRDEVETGNYDVTIMGGSGKRRMAHDLVQYIDSSIFVVNQYNPNQDYRLLLAVDDSPGTRRAVKYGIRVAQAFNIGVDILTISKTNNFGDGYQAAAERAAKFMRRSGIEAKNVFKTGDPSQIIVDVAGNNHIIVMGSSRRNPIKKFFQGSKPLTVMENCKCPILIVK